MRALVTGSSGFLGRHFAAELENRGYLVSHVDLADGGDALDLFRHGHLRYDLIVHAAAQAPHRAGIDGQPTSHVYNQLLDAAMFDYAIRTRPGGVLYLSSCAVLDATLDDYGLVKSAGERLAACTRAAGVNVTVVRPYSGYGHDQADVFPFGSFLAQARRRDDPLQLWNPDAVRDWIHVDDLVAAALEVAAAGTSQPVALCTGIGTSCGDLARMVADAAGYQPTLAPQDDKPAGTPRRVGDPTLMRRYYTPKITLAEGIRQAIEQGR
jgi:nucleoside-diphosphate-sugar epimerase